MPLARAQELFGALWGNLLISDRRLLFEPYSCKRVAYAPHGMKHTHRLKARL
jgi:hypothetical protein